MSKRVGPQMSSVVYYVSNHPGCSKLAAATYVLPHAIGKNNAYAYGPVNRAIQAGLIVARQRTRCGRYSLTVAP